jgi:RimJ/RimL family protein N-acetyltransferase
LGLPPEQLLASITTLREAQDWYLVRTGSASPEVEHPLATVLETMQTRSQRLRAVGAADLPLLYDSAMDPRWNWRYRYRGYTQSFQEFVNGIWSGSACQYIVERRADSMAVGHLSLYGMRPEAGIASFAVTRIATSAAPSTDMFEGLLLFLGLCFRNWPLRKIYAEVPGFNWSQFEIAEHYLLDVEGVLKSHDYYAGRYWDQRIVAIYRERYEEQMAPAGTLSRLFLTG